MSNKVKTFLRSIYGSINKSDAELDLEKSISYLGEIIDAYQMTESAIPDGKFTDNANKDMVKRFYTEMARKMPHGMSLSITNNFLLDVRILLSNVRDNGKEVQAKLRDFKSNVISSTAMGADTAAILRSVPHYYFISRYAVELLNFLLANEIKALNSTPTNIPPRQVQDIKENMVIFTTLLGGYGCPYKDFKNRVDAVPESILTKGEDSLVDEYQYDNRIDIVPGLPNGFIGSPIYTIRSGIAKWQADRYHAAEDNKRLLELRLNYYESLRDNGNVNAEVEKEIQYLQGQVSKLAAKLEKMEASVQ